MNTKAACADAVSNTSCPARPSRKPVWTAQATAAVPAAATTVVTVAVAATTRPSATSEYTGCPDPPATSAAIAAAVTPAHPSGKPNPPGILPFVHMAFSALRPVGPEPGADAFPTPGAAELTRS
ncbi:MAG TPA: hypothetical protein VJX66_12235 [Amycolatopsis sp.]|nr:hypothetical protein [Amycolatopsis sp.]